ncbi:enoyl-CoA hydratase/isomerase family protein [Bordetella sp. 2513F-2]
MTADSPIHIEHRADGACRITVDRARKHNALSREVLARLADAVAEAGARPATRLVLLSGAGERYFAAGGDLVDLASVRDAAATREMAREASAALDVVRESPVPVVAYLNGDAIGGGAELALACDLRLLAPHARIGFVQARMAITSAWGGGPDLCRLVGGARALRMMSRCELVDAEQAVSWGLADAVAAGGSDGAGAQAFLAPMLACPPQVLRGIKAQALAWRRGEALQACRDVEQRHLIETWLHDDHWRAVEAFLSKGKR